MDENTLFYKWNNDEIKKGSRLIIRPAQDAIFLYQGRVEGVFTEEGERYRGKEYVTKLKDEDGQWSAELVDGCYTFNVPINKNLQISDPGTYSFHLEQKMPITPIVGVKELVLLNN